MKALGHQYRHAVAWRTTQPQLASNDLCAAVNLRPGHVLRTSGHILRAVDERERQRIGLLLGTRLQQRGKGVRHRHRGTTSTLVGRVHRLPPAPRRVRCIRVTNGVPAPPDGTAATAPARNEPLCGVRTAKVLVICINYTALT